MTLFETKNLLVPKENGGFDIVKPDDRGRRAFDLFLDLDRRFHEQLVNCDPALCYYLVKLGLMARFLNHPDSASESLSTTFWPPKAVGMYTQAEEFFFGQLRDKIACIALSEKSKVGDIYLVIDRWLGDREPAEGSQVLRLLKRYLDVGDDDCGPDGYWKRPAESSKVNEEEAASIRKALAIDGHPKLSRLADFHIVMMRQFGKEHDHDILRMIAIAIDWKTVQDPNLAHRLFQSAAPSGDNLVEDRMLWAISAEGVELSLASGIPFPFMVNAINSFLKIVKADQGDEQALLRKLEMLDIKPLYDKWIERFRFSYTLHNRNCSGYLPI
jgi:hypothetical protein